MNTESTLCITGAVRAADSAAVSPGSTVPAHHPSQYIPRPHLRVVISTAIDSEGFDDGDDTDDIDGERVWTELERMLAAREAARALHPAGANLRSA
jgi:hypothetical protein